MNERVLLITPQFYGIEKIIKSALEESHYEVFWIENKTIPFDFHGTKSKFKFLRKISFFLLSPQEKYLKRELSKIENQEFDILFSVNAHIICPYLFRKLKNINPDLFSVLFLWDSFSMYNWTKELKFFNKAYTFDHTDSIKYHINYKPNFYIKSNISIYPEIINDLFFVGKFSYDRLIMIDKIFNLPGISDIKSYLKVWPSYKMNFHYLFMYKIFKKFRFKSVWIKNYLMNFEAVEGIITRDYIINEPLSYNELSDHFLRSNVILDLPYKYQKGYTHRMIEALAKGKKVITTNSSVRDESFYNPEQVHIIDYLNPEIDISWLRKKLIFPVDNCFVNLELSEWLKSILNVATV
jgi:hypothetical protein